MSRIALIWQPAYGAGLVDRLTQAGHELRYLERTTAAAASQRAARPATGRSSTTMAEALEGAEFVMTLLATPQEVEEVYLADGGVFEKAPAGATFIDLTTSHPRLARELHALAAVHDHAFVEAPFELGAGLVGASGADGADGTDGASDGSRDADTPAAGGAGGDGDGASSADDASGGSRDATTLATTPAVLSPQRIFMAGEPDHLALVRPLVGALAPEVLDCGLPGMGMSLRLASLIATAQAIMGVIEAVSFARLAGLEDARILAALNGGMGSSPTAAYYASLIVDENYQGGAELRQFFNELTVALDAADELDLILPGVEVAYQLADLLVMVGGAEKGVHALALLYTDEERATQQGLNWELAQRAMDVYERVGEGYDEDDYYDDEDYDDEDCGHHHYFDDDEGTAPPSMGRYFSEN